MTQFLKRLRSQSGAALVEYALIASLILLPSVAAINTISDTMNDEFDAIEDNAASAGHGTTTTLAPGTTTSTTTTTAAPAGTTTTTAAPATTTTSTTTTSTTTTTAAPASTTTTAAPPATTTTAAPAYQEQTVDTWSGEFTFAVIDGEIQLIGYDLNYGWSGYLYYESDGDLVVKMNRSWGGSQTIKAWLDDDGNLHVTIY